MDVLNVTPQFALPSKEPLYSRTEEEMKPTGTFRG